MAQIENLPLVLTGLGLTASVLYYTMVLRNANKTQQMQLETRQVQLFEYFLEKITLELWELQYEVINEWSWETPEDFFKKYGHPYDPNSELEKLVPLLAIYERMGILLKEGLFDIEMMYDMVGGTPIRLWEKLEPIADYWRTRYETGVKGMMWEYFEDFAYAFMEVRDRDREKYNQRFQRRKQTRAKYGKTIPEYNK